MVDVKQVADAADMIVNGYAFTRCTEGFRVLNLNRPDRAVVFSNDGRGDTRKPLWMTMSYRTVAIPDFSGTKPTGSRCVSNAMTARR